MTIQQTVDIPADRHIRFDFTLPEGAPKGQTTMILTFSSPKAAETIQPHLTRALIDDMLPGSITQSLLGFLKRS
jgi:hypothetical protein